MKLEKFTKNKKQKQIVIGSIIGILLIIGGISLYRSFAMYKVEKTFDVLQGTIPDFRSDVTLALMVNGKSTDTIPNQNSNYAIQVNCDKGVGIWNRESWGIEIKNIEKSKVKCNIEFTTLTANTSIFNFDYKGKEDAISLPSGKYKLEVWGAQGGLGLADTQSGYGGYSKGEVQLTSATTLYINVGGQGENAKESGISLGGYNGGGNGSYGFNIMHGTGGGGATHIAKVSGLLSTLGQNIEQILIVAGGGGGNGGNTSHEGRYPLGGSGGGYQGANGINSDFIGADGYLGTGGTQSEGGHDTFFTDKEEVKGKFGLGGNNYNDATGEHTSWGGSGGGGGYYGGGGSSRGHAGAGGGSGYIGNELLMNKGMWCYECDESGELNTKTTKTTNVSSEPTSRYAKQGNGFARITYLGN